MRRAGLLTRVQETVAALPVVQVYGREETERARFRGVAGRVYAWAMRMTRLEVTSLGLPPFVLSPATARGRSQRS